MTAILVWVLVSCVTLVAAILGGVLGFGTAAVLLPLLTLVLGPRTAVPVLAIAMVFSNASRAAFSWKEIDWKAVFAYSVTGVPFSILGASYFNGAAGRSVNLIIAIFLLTLVPVRRLGNRMNIKVRLSHLPWLGGAIGLVTGLGGAVGPAAAPFYLSYGLVKAPYVGTDGMNSMFVHGFRSIMYWRGGATTAFDGWIGCALGLIMILGSFIGRKLVDRLDPNAYTKYVEVFLIGIGTYMLVRAFIR